MVVRILHFYVYVYHSQVIIPLVCIIIKGEIRLVVFFKSSDGLMQVCQL